MMDRPTRLECDREAYDAGWQDGYHGCDPKAMNEPYMRGYDTGRNIREEGEPDFRG